jgi:hypothetical protein
LQGSDGFRKLRIGADLGYTGDGSDLEVVVVAARVRFVSALIAVLAIAVFLVSSGSAGSKAGGQPQQQQLPTLYVYYTMNCTFAIFDDNNNPVTSIPPGSYQVFVTTPEMFKLVRPGGVGVDNIAANDFTGCKGWVQFQITGPGVSLFSTLESGCDAFLLLPSQTFKPGQTYVFQDLNQPALTRTTINVALTGTPPIPTKSPYDRLSGKGSTQKELAGSGAVQFRGTLGATLSAQGKPVLTSKGKPVSILKSGSYKFAITDQDAKGSFVLQRIKAGSGFKPNDLTGVKFVGKISKTLTLKAGRWAYSSGHGTAYNFLVTT